MAESGDRPHVGAECVSNHSMKGAPWGPETRTSDVGRGYAPDARAIWHARPPTLAASGYRASGAYPRPTALRVSRHSALDDVNRQPTARGFLVLVMHVAAGVAHGLDDLVQADLVLAVAAQGHARGVDRLLRAHPVAFGARDRTSDV